MKTKITPHTPFPVSSEHTLAAWRCDENDYLDFVDEVGDYTLADINGCRKREALFGVNRGATGARAFNGTNDYAYKAGTTASRAAFRLPVTVCAIFEPQDVVGFRTMFNHGGLRTNDTGSTENITFLLGLANDEIKCGWEYGSGANEILTTTTFNIVAGSKYVVVASRYPTISGAAGNMDLRVDLWDVGTKTLATEYRLDCNPPDGGSNANLYLGCEQGPANFFDGEIDEVHVVKFGDPHGHFARWFFGLTVGFDYDEDVLYETKSQETHVRVKLEDSEGVMIDLTNLEPDSTNYVQSVQIDRSVDSFSRTASIVLRREFDSFSLAPDMEGSLFNTDSGGSYGPQVHLRRRVFVEVAVVPAGREPQDWDFVLHFDGLTNNVSWPDEEMTLLVNDLSQELESTFMLTQRSYAGTPISSIDDSGAANRYVVQFSEPHHLSALSEFTVFDTENYDGLKTVLTVDSTTQVTTSQTGTGSIAVESVGYIQQPTLIADVINQIIADNDPAGDASPDVYKGGTPTVWETTALTWTLRYFVQNYGNVMEAIADLASQPGALLSFEFDDFQQVYRLYLREPDRSATWSSGMASFGEIDLIGEPSEVSFSLDDIRTKLTVGYFDLDGTADSDGGYPKAEEVAVNLTALGKYGLRASRISNTWNIDSSTEAQALADAGVDDMSEPLAFVSVDVHFRRYLEVNDLGRFDLPSRHFSSSKDLAMTSISEVISSNGFAMSSLSLRGLPSGSPSAWQNMMDPANDRHNRLPLPAANVIVEAVPDGLVARWDPPVNPGKRSVDWYEVHISKTGAAFTPSASTLQQVVRGSGAFIGGLDANDDYTVHIVARDLQRNESAKSTFKVLAPTYTALNKPAFKAYENADRTLTGTGENQFDTDATDYHHGSCYSLTTDRFVAPVKGIYRFTAKIRLDFSKTVQYSKLYVKTSAGVTLLDGDFYFGDTISNYVTARLNDTLEMGALDDAELFIYHSDACLIKGSLLESHWSGELITQLS